MLQEVEEHDSHRHIVLVSDKRRCSYTACDECASLGTLRSAFMAQLTVRFVPAIEHVDTIASNKHVDKPEKCVRYQ